MNPLLKHDKVRILAAREDVPLAQDLRGAVVIAALRRLERLAEEPARVRGRGVDHGAGGVEVPRSLRGPQRRVAGGLVAAEAEAVSREDIEVAYAAPMAGE